jgi:hypothetical protein
MAKITNPFAPQPSSPGPSPLAATQRNFAPRITVESVQEAQRAERVKAELIAGGAALAPTFKPVATPAPYTTSTPIGTPPKPEAGGSKT